jgi:pimeloyl-ACP methyl ester carboxylesterase
MQLSVNGVDTFVATGGRPFDPSLPTVVMLHGAGFDHSTWALHSRWFAHHGYSVLAPDLPGHGRSPGKPLPTIAGMADWTAALLDAAGAPKAKLVGHSMGSLIALETAARHPDKVSGLSLIGTAATMTVGPDLLKAAEANDPDAIDMVSIWGLGFKAELGGSLAPGLWMHQGAQRVLQQTRPGVLFNDLNACNAYQNALAAAAQVKVPATFILGERDMMTPAKAGKTLAAATPNARTVVLPGAGHMMMVEQPTNCWRRWTITTAAPPACVRPDGCRSRAGGPSAAHPS